MVLNDAVWRCYIPSNGTICCKYWIGKDVEASGFSFIPGTTTALVSRDRGRLQHTSFIIVCLQVWIWDLPNTDKQREVFKTVCWSLQGTKALPVCLTTLSNYTPSSTGKILIMNSKEWPCSENGRRKITQNSTEVDAKTKKSTKKTEEKTGWLV